MKTIIKVILFFFGLSLMLLSCSQDDQTTAEQPIAVTYNSIAGSWQLTRYYDQPLLDGQYLHITFDRKEHTWVMRGNLSSHNERIQSGTYSISGDSYHGYELSGTYGIVAGDWQHSYRIQLYPSGRMIWTATDNPSYTQVFERMNNK